MHITTQGPCRKFAEVFISRGCGIRIVWYFRGATAREEEGLGSVNVYMYAYTGRYFVFVINSFDECLRV